VGWLWLSRRVYARVCLLGSGMEIGGITDLRDRDSVGSVFSGAGVQLLAHHPVDTRLGCSVFGSSVSCLAI